MNLAVCCVQTGNYEGRGADYVHALANAAKRRITAPHRFICLTDAPEILDGRVETIPAPECAPGWFAKLALFQDGLFDASIERVLFFDLDTLIIANIDDLANYDGPFAGLGDFRTGAGTFASGVMAWPNGFGGYIWSDWLDADRPMPPGGDDHWIAYKCPEALRLQRIVPGIVSFKFHKCRTNPPPDARIVCFQRRPKPHEVESDWVRFVWKS